MWLSCRSVVMSWRYELLSIAMQHFKKRCTCRQLSIDGSYLWSAHHDPDSVREHFHWHLYSQAIGRRETSWALPSAISCHWRLPTARYTHNQSSEDAKDFTEQVWNVRPLTVDVFACDNKSTKPKTSSIWRCPKINSKNQVSTSKSGMFQPLTRDYKRKVFALEITVLVQDLHCDLMYQGKQTRCSQMKSEPEFGAELRYNRWLNVQTLLDLFLHCNRFMLY